MSIIGLDISHPKNRMHKRSQATASDVRKPARVAGRKAVNISVLLHKTVLRLEFLIVFNGVINLTH
jgi:hypothetical protein